MRLFNDSLKSFAWQAIHGTGLFRIHNSCRFENLSNMLTQIIHINFLVRLVGMALAGSSGQKCLGYLPFISF